MILQPRGPVMFVYDVADTEPLNQHSRPLPQRVTDPFAVTWHADVEKVMTRTVENAARDGIRVTYTPSGADQAGVCHAGPRTGHDQFRCPPEARACDRLCSGAL